MLEIINFSKYYYEGYTLFLIWYYIQEVHMNKNYPEMIVKKSDGASESEKYLIQKCQNTFLSLWSYPNPYTADKKAKELCDVLAVFGNHIFLFSDKYCRFDDNQKVEVAWNRWYKHAIDAGAKQLIGAERYIKQDKPIYLDAKHTQRFPLPIPNGNDVGIHRIIVARGIRRACTDFYIGGHGSLIVNTTFIGSQHLLKIDKDGNSIKQDRNPIFTAGFIADRDHYCHVFDDFTLDCIMDELDTVSDFIDYLEQKERMVNAGKDIIASGEEEILGRYLSIIEKDQHCIVTEQEMHSYQCFEFSGFWDRYVHNPDRLTKVKENEDSYIWDNLLESAFRNMMAGTLRDMSHPDYQTQAIMFQRFAEPCRVERRELARSFLGAYASAIQTIDQNSTTPITFVRRIQLFARRDTLITILWLHCPKDQPIEDYLAFRRRCLEAKILSLLPASRDSTYHIGIAKFLDTERDNSEDFVYVNANDFPDGCDGIKDAQEYLATYQSSLLGRAAKHINAKEYSDIVEAKDVPYPWQ